MKIAVCIKEVPDTDRVRIDRKTNTLIRTGIPVIINPDDLIALEAALRIKDRTEDVHVTTVSMGPPQVKDSLLKTYLLGADRTVLLTDREFAGSDTFATSYTLASFLKDMRPDLILCGKQAIDGDTAQVGPGIAEHLSIPQVTYVKSISGFTGQSVTVERDMDCFSESIEVKLPCLLTISSRDIMPRYISIKRFIKKDEHSVETVDATGIKADAGFLGLDGSPTRVVKVFTPEQAQAGKIFEDPDQGINEVAEFLKRVKRY